MTNQTKLVAVFYCRYIDFLIWFLINGLPYTETGVTCRCAADHGFFADACLGRPTACGAARFGTRDGATTCVIESLRMFRWVDLVEVPGKNSLSGHIFPVMGGICSC